MKREGKKKKRKEWYNPVPALRKKNRSVASLCVFFSRCTLYLFSRLADATWIKITRRNKMAKEGMGL